MWNGVFGPARYEHAPLVKHIRHKYTPGGRGHHEHMPDHIIVQSIELVDADFDPRLEDLVADEVDIAELGDGEFHFLVTIGWEEGDALYHYFYDTDNPEPDPEEVKAEIARYHTG